MALVIFLCKPPKHGSIVHIRFRVAVPVEEKEIAVTVNRDLLRSLAVFQHAPQRFIHFFTHWDLSDTALRFGLLCSSPFLRSVKAGGLH